MSHNGKTKSLHQMKRRFLHSHYAPQEKSQTVENKVDNSKLKSTIWGDQTYDCLNKVPRADELVKLCLYFSNKDIISLSAHNHSVVVSIRTLKRLWQNFFCSAGKTKQAWRGGRTREAGIERMYWRRDQMMAELPGRSPNWGTRRVDFTLDISTFFLKCIMKIKTTSSHFFPSSLPLILFHSVLMCPD